VFASDKDEGDRRKHDEQNRKPCSVGAETRPQRAARTEEQDDED
jgi:hypothetical protein